MDNWEVDIQQIINQFKIETTQSIGVVPGGTTGQILAKRSDTNYDTEWISIATTFIGLIDTPSTYVGQAGKVPVVNIGENTLEFQTISSDKISAESGNLAVDVSQGDSIIHMQSPLSTGNILELISDSDGTPTPVFEVDGNGDIYNNSSKWLYVGTNDSVLFGTGQNHSLFSRAAAGGVVGLGAGVLQNAQSPHNTTAVGYLSGNSIVNAQGNSLFGVSTGRSLISTDKNTFIGQGCGRFATGTSCVYFGSDAGFWQTIANNKFILDGLRRTNLATEDIDSLMVGQFDLNAFDQWVDHNYYMSVRYGFNLMRQITPSGTADIQGNQGDIEFNDNYLYYKSSAGWKRAALSTF